MISARDFLRAAEQRFATAQFLLEQGRGEFTIEALYLAGYSVECALKSLILSLTPDADLEDRFIEISKGARTHNWEVLSRTLREQETPLPAEIVRGLGRFAWSTDLRYVSGRRPASEVRGYLKVASRVIEWVEEELS